MMSRRLLFSGVLLMLAACAPSVSELQTFQKLQGAGDFEEIAQKPVACTVDQDGCTRTIEIKADACLRRAQEQITAADAATAAPYAACATQNYTVALDAGQNPAALGARRLEAVRLSRESATDTATGTAHNRDLVANAEGYAAANPRFAEGSYYAADALFWRAAFTETGASSCGTLASAAQLAGTATGASGAPSGIPGGVGARASRLEREIAALGATRGCAS